MAWAFVWRGNLAQIWICSFWRIEWIFACAFVGIDELHRRGVSEKGTVEFSSGSVISG